MREWFNRPYSKQGVAGRSPQVRILLPPQSSISLRFNYRASTNGSEGGKENLFSLIRC